MHTVRSPLPILALFAVACSFDVTAVGGAVSIDGSDPHDGSAPLDLDAPDRADAKLPPTLDLSPDDLSGTGLLSVSYGESPTMVDLTALGTDDWAHWGLTSATDFDHKLGGTRLPDRMLLGALGASQYGDNLTGFTWSNGAPHATASNSTTGIFTFGLGTGFELDVPADNTTRQLLLFVGGYHAEGSLKVSLSDQSATDYKDKEANTGGAFSGLYTIRYRAASSGQKMVVTWVESFDYAGGNVTLQAAALGLP
jgi:hypothetical protein